MAARYCNREAMTMTAGQSTPLLLVVARIYWLFLGPVILGALTLVAFSSKGGWLTMIDFMFLALLGGLILARWYEFRGGNPQTNMGEPATWAHFRRYALITVLFGLSVWVLTNLLENHVLSR